MARHVLPLGQVDQAPLPEGTPVRRQRVRHVCVRTECPCLAGEAALQEGDSFFPQSQSLADALQQPGAARGQPREVRGTGAAVLCFPPRRLGSDRLKRQTKKHYNRHLFVPRITEKMINGTFRYTFSHHQVQQIV